MRALQNFRAGVVLQSGSLSQADCKRMTERYYCPKGSSELCIFIRITTPNTPTEIFPQRAFTCNLFALPKKETDKVILAMRGYDKEYNK